MVGHAVQCLSACAQAHVVGALHMPVAHEQHASFSFLSAFDVWDSGLLSSITLLSFFAFVGVSCPSSEFSTEDWDSADEEGEAEDEEDEEDDEDADEEDEDADEEDEGTPSFRLASPVPFSFFSVFFGGIADVLLGVCL